MLVDGSHIHAENHLPITLLVMHGNILIHDISQIFLIGRHAIDETNQRAIFHGSGEAGVVIGVSVDQKPEMFRICGDAFVAASAGGKQAASPASIASKSSIVACRMSMCILSRKAYPIFTFRYELTAESADVQYCGKDYREAFLEG